MKWVCVCLFCVSCFVHGGGITYIFDEIKEGKETPFSWKVEQKDKALLLIGKKNETQTFIECTPDYVFQKLSFKGTTESYSLVREGDFIVATGTVDGKTLKKSYKIGDEPWVQQFWFGLRPFVTSNDNKLKFSIINPKDFDRYKMVAIKESVEEMEISGRKVLAQRMKITLQGFKSMFWSGKIWFDAKTAEFLKYQATEGPNTPLTTVLFSKKEEE